MAQPESLDLADESLDLAINMGTRLAHEASALAVDEEQGMEDAISQATKKLRIWGAKRNTLHTTTSLRVSPAARSDLSSARNLLGSRPTHGQVRWGGECERDAFRLTGCIQAGAG
jgi:hypothetical protein